MVGNHLARINSKGSVKIKEAHWLLVAEDHGSNPGGGQNCLFCFELGSHD